MNHQLKFAFINLKKSFFSTSLNLFGLISAFAAFILIMLYVWNEQHFDSFNRHFNEIYRIEIKVPEQQKTSVFLCGPTGETLVNEFPEVLASTTYMAWGKWAEGTFSWETSTGLENSFEDYSYADKYLTDVFTFDFINGDSENPLIEPQSAIVSESFAQKAWGAGDPVGKILKSGGQVYTISGVFKDLPDNSVITCPIILKMPETGWIADAAKGWDITNYPQFILVEPGTDPEILNKKINNQSIVNSKYTYFNKGTETVSIVARPLSDLHFTDEVAETPLFAANSKMFVNSLFWVGILVLLVALINYVNFATANVPRRIKSISISRIIGGSRLNNISVFMIETLIIFISSFLIAASISWIVNEKFSAAVLGYRLSFFENYRIWAGFIFVGIFVGVLSSLYPAVYGTVGRPIELLKKKYHGSKINFRGILTISQFVVTIVLIALSVLVIKQVRFMENTNIGFNKDNTLVIRMNNDLNNNYTAFENQLRSSPFIKDIARSRAVPGQAVEMNVYNVNGKNCRIWNWAVDDNYIDMMDFEIAEGRDFIKNSKADLGNLICNESAMKKYGWQLGDKIDENNIVGVLKDFNFISLREEVEPFTFRLAEDDNRFSNISVKLATDNVASALTVIEDYFKEVCPESPMRYFFLDDHLNMLYLKENQQVRLITTFSLLSVIVSILGIFGLSVFMCQYKIKEIGVRKVNGAKVSEVVAMLNRDFVRWVAIAFIIATPVAWIIMHRWLESFAFKTGLSWWIFALSGFLAFSIALLTVSYQTWKAASRNPVEALRYE